jgi:hypothetical protein
MHAMRVTAVTDCLTLLPPNATFGLPPIQGVINNTLRSGRRPLKQRYFAAASQPASGGVTSEKPTQRPQAMTPIQMGSDRAPARWRYV